MKPKKQTYNFGIFAEKIAMSFLRLKGYEILEWRFKTKLGEVDIIAKKSDIIIAIEVKARSKKVTIEELVSFRQMKRVRSAMELFIAQNSKYHNSAVRFDFIEVGKWGMLRHHQNFFTY